MRYPFAVWGLAALLAFGAGTACADGIDEMTRLLKAGDATAEKTVARQAPGGDPRAIRLTPDRTRILRLRENAASVIVANPAHAAVTLDSPRLLILMPREPGTTSFTVLNAEGKILLERNIIVSGTAQPQYVRVRRVCGDNTQGCQPSNYYYCPDGCFEVTPVVHEDSGSVPEVPGGAGAFPGDGAGDAGSMIVEEMEGPMIHDDYIPEPEMMEGE